MPDREKVLRALKLCSTTKERIASGETIARKACADCPYNYESCEDMARDALSLLKEQEAVIKRLIEDARILGDAWDEEEGRND